jgi:hypothetical protein
MAAEASASKDYLFVGLNILFVEIFGLFRQQPIIEVFVDYEVSLHLVSERQKATRYAWFMLPRAFAHSHPSDNRPPAGLSVGVLRSQREFWLAIFRFFRFAVKRIC